MPKSVLPRARAPPPLDKREARARARGSTIFETAQNAEICTPPRPCPPALTPRGKSVLPRRGQSTGAGEYDFRDFQGSKMPKSVLPRDGAGAPQPRGQSTGTGQYDFRDFQGSKSQKSVLPRARGPEARTGTREYDFETFKAQNAEICTPAPVPPRPCMDKREARARARGSTIFETFRAQKCRNLYSPATAPVPPSPEARARARGSTIFETFKAQKAEICTPPRPWPPAPMDPMQVWKNFHIMSSTSTLEPHGPGIGQE